MSKTSRRKPNFILEDDLSEQASLKRSCQHKTCGELGDYRAPKTRDCAEYYWFCLDHVREYNQQWDYYKGMEPEEIDSHRKADMTWQRPSWPLGGGTTRHFIHANRKIHDPFSIFKEELQSAQSKPSPFPPHSDESKALALLNLEMPLEFIQLKTRYKILVKKYHPDHNPNDPQAEDRIKAINHAYSVLKKVL